MKYECVTIITNQNRFGEIEKKHFG